MNSIVRRRLKLFYKQRKVESSLQGRKINDFMQILHEQYRTPKEKRDAEKIKNTLEKLTELRKEKRFIDEFPSFSMFRKYLKKEKITLDDLESLGAISQ